MQSTPSNASPSLMKQVFNKYNPNSSSFPTQNSTFGPFSKNNSPNSINTPMTPTSNTFLGNIQKTQEQLTNKSGQTHATQRVVAPDILNKINSRFTVNTPNDQPSVEVADATKKSNVAKKSSKIPNQQQDKQYAQLDQLAIRNSQHQLAILSSNAPTVYSNPLNPASSGAISKFPTSFHDNSGLAQNKNNLQFNTSFFNQTSAPNNTAPIASGQNISSSSFFNSNNTSTATNPQNTLNYGSQSHNFEQNQANAAFGNDSFNFGRNKPNPFGQPFNTPSNSNQSNRKTNTLKLLGNSNASQSDNQNQAQRNSVNSNTNNNNPFQQSLVNQNTSTPTPVQNNSNFSQFFNNHSEQNQFQSFSGPPPQEQYSFRSEPPIPPLNNNSFLDFDQLARINQEQDISFVDFLKQSYSNINYIYQGLHDLSNMLPVLLEEFNQNRDLTERFIQFQTTLRLEPDDTLTKIGSIQNKIAEINTCAEKIQCKMGSEFQHPVSAALKDLDEIEDQIAQEQLQRPHQSQQDFINIYNQLSSIDSQLSELNSKADHYLNLLKTE